MVGQSRHSGRGFHCSQQVRLGEGGEGGGRGEGGTGVGGIGWGGEENLQDIMESSKSRKPA